MSEIIDEFIYNFYDYVQSIYVYSHLKTNLVDVNRQILEKITSYIFAIVATSFVVFFVFKILLIIFYFLFFQAFIDCFSFMKNYCKRKCSFHFCSSFMNGLSLLGKIFLRTYTFNFYLYQNLFITLFMSTLYIFTILVSAIFYIINAQKLKYHEKEFLYVNFFYIHFECLILLQLLCTCFYSCQNMVIAFCTGIGFFFVLNGILFTGYYIKEIYENENGIFEYDEPQKVINIIFNLIFLLINLLSFSKLICRKKGKKKFNFIYRIEIF